MVDLSKYIMGLFKQQREISLLWICEGATIFRYMKGLSFLSNGISLRKKQCLDLNTTCLLI